jgi:aminopeptidase
LDDPDPAKAWEEHGQQINARCEYMTSKGYASLKFTGPGTDLTLGLPRGHKWCGAFMTRQDGLPYVANLPTEEIFTLPHRDQAEGHLTVSMPLSYGGALMEDFTLSFKEGQIVNAEAKSGLSVLQNLLETDSGSNRLGEIALVPHSSPVAQTGLLFYNILVDENAATHCALGSAYKFSLEGGDGLSDDEFISLGGNPSILHVDFMIGSEHMDVDGIMERGNVEPVMRAGEWAFEV